ncbi:hypothetical protein [Micromonospora craniellae]|uniref:hypothetical protein n=1 Tax=Micromonospora craniellae TaxID=2294034 RepID=UPI0013140E67|nr:hypothetical protein [Micromonospora craniellae]QOC90957.1 hypothetical protein ID554_23300 [Micromonospora craniellae]
MDTPLREPTFPIGQSYWGWYGWTAEQLLPFTCAAVVPPSLPHPARPAADTAVS